ncbi:hypothetical protein DPMN_057365 [Dreissena polymorpha]|uniref:Uncharacterized protein n=1 Tax=Dreissena polymorpha TaxID=45954 RepID=A0A9D4BZY8_DREPO|nr:hypothetical protein DPMN_057365 [Dreissena polymorpha]
MSEEVEECSRHQLLYNKIGTTRFSPTRPERPAPPRHARLAPERHDRLLYDRTKTTRSSTTRPAPHYLPLFVFQPVGRHL